MSDIKTTQVEFTGKASEYFGIWIVNLLLSLLTLGIYSAWAKVRRKKYFYHHTQIDQVGFDYHAKPLNILKGRLIAFALFLAYAFGGELNFFIPMIAVVVFVLALPWLVVRASIFNARNSSHRGLRFDFVGKVGKAVKIYLLMPALAVLSLYLAWPYVDHQRNQFLVSNHRFGLSAFDFKAKVSSFYRIYAVALIVPFIGILVAVAIPAYVAYQERAEQHSTISIPFSVGFVEMDNSRQIVLAENTTEEEPYRVERVYSESEDAEDRFDDSEFIESGKVVTEKSLEEMIAEAQREKQHSREKMIADMLKTPAKAMFGIGFVFAYLVFIFAFVAYFKSRIANLVWNNTTLDNLTFKSTLRARDYLWIYVSNIIAIALTFGLATPWAQIRLARYRASKLQLVGDVDFDKFVGDKKEEVKATGEEIADFFDVDFSFG